MTKSSEWIEKHRIIIGGVLVFLILVGGGVLAWKLNNTGSNIKATDNKEIANAEAEIKELKKQVEELKKAASQTSATQQAQAAPTLNQETGTGQAGPAAPSTGKVAGAQTKSGMVNLNTASLSELDSLSGIGPVYAQRIIDYRNQNGSFKSIEEVSNVKGIGPKTFEKFKDRVTVD